MQSYWAVSAEAATNFEIANDDRIADEKRNERFIFFGVTKVIAKASHHPFFRGKGLRAAGHMPRVKRDDRGAPFLLRSELVK